MTQQANLQRAVNSQPWLPRGRLVETSVTQEAYNHEDCDIPLKKWHPIQEALSNAHLHARGKPSTMITARVANRDTACDTSMKDVMSHDII